MEAGSHCVDEVQRSLEVVCSCRREETGARDAVLAVEGVDTCSMCVPLQAEEASAVVLHLLLNKPRRLYTEEH